MMVSPHPLYSLLDTEVSEWGFDLHPFAAFPSFPLGGLCLCYRCSCIWLIFCNISKEGQGGRAAKAIWLELVEDKHHAIYVEQSKARERTNLSTSLSCSPYKCVFHGHTGLLHHHDLTMDLCLFKNTLLEREASCMESKEQYHMDVLVMMRFFAKW